MKFDRRKQMIKVGEDEFIIQSLFPVDFLAESSWPFHFYQNKALIEQKEDDIHWGLKPKSVKKQEAVVKYAIKKGVVSPALSDEKLNEVFLNDFKRGFLVGCLFILTYGMEGDFTTDGKKLFYRGESREIDPDKLYEIYLKSKMQGGAEPWALMFGPSEIPEGYNPKRYDFNNLVFTTGLLKDTELRAAANA